MEALLAYCGALVAMNERYRMGEHCSCLWWRFFHWNPGIACAFSWQVWGVWEWEWDLGGLSLGSLVLLLLQLNSTFHEHPNPNPVSP